MKHKFLYIAVFVVLVFAVCAGYVSLALRQQAAANAVVASLQGMKSTFLEKMELKSAPAEKVPVSSGEACRYVNEGYGFSVMKPWTIEGTLAGYSENIGKWLPKSVLNGEMTRGTAATTVANPRVIYFATRPVNGPASVNRLYSFDLDTHKLNKLYEKNAVGEMVWHVRGFDGSKLVILEEGVDNSPGPCAPEWGTENYFAFDIAAPAVEFVPYRVPQCLVDLANAKGQACANAISAAEDSAYGDNADGGTAR